MSGESIAGLPAAILWDMDGTIVDTEPVWIASEYHMAKKYGGAWTEEDSAALIGCALDVGGQRLKDKVGIDKPVHEIVVEWEQWVVDQLESMPLENVPWCPGVRELLAEAKTLGVPCALVTMSWTGFAGTIVSRLPEGTFAAIVTGDVVENGKPHPEPYLKAASLLGVDPAACIAIEDSNTGSTSAEAAGCAVVTVPNHEAVALTDRRVQLPSLGGVSVEHLAKLTADLRGL